jgi:hypothetical protein
MSSTVYNSCARFRNAHPCVFLNWLVPVLPNNWEFLPIETKAGEKLRDRWLNRSKLLDASEWDFRVATPAELPLATAYEYLREDEQLVALAAELQDQTWDVPFAPGEPGRPAVSAAETFLSGWRCFPVPWMLLRRDACVSAGAEYARTLREEGWQPLPLGRTTGDAMEKLDREMLCENLLIHGRANGYLVGIDFENTPTNDIIEAATAWIREEASKVKSAKIESIRSETGLKDLAAYRLNKRAGMSHKDVSEMIRTLPKIRHDTAILPDYGSASSFHDAAHRAAERLDRMKQQKAELH